MKIKGLLIGMLACTALVGCTNEDVIDNPNENPVLNGDKGYMQIRLVNADRTISRGEPNTPSFFYGTAEENAVETTQFYFFEEDGKPYNDGNNEVTKLLSWNPDSDDEAVADNIESVAEAVVVLEHLKVKTSPKLVVAVLNAPAKYKYSKTTTDGGESTSIIETTSLKGLNLNEVKSALAESYKNGTGQFVMTNSSYSPVTTKDIKEDFATIIPDGCFLTEAPNKTLTSTDPVVDIYVERLAAKVKVALDQDQEQFASDEITIGTYPVKNGTNTSTNTEIKIKIVGWGLNATTKNNYAIKHINSNAWNTLNFWNDAPNKISWNDDANHRSYWAQSPNYDSGTYPASFAAATEGNGTIEKENSTEKTDATKYTLNYFSWNEMEQDLNKSLYCMENTNTADILRGRAANQEQDKTELVPSFYSAATQVVIAAQTVDKNDLIRYNKTLYTEDGFWARVMNELNLEIYTKTQTEGTDTPTDASDDVFVYAQLDKNGLTVENAYDGKVRVALTAATKNVSQWYKVKTPAVYEADGTTIKTPAEYDVYTDAATVLETRVASLALAEYYKSGMMHYVIPIEHLRGGEFKYENNEAKVEEGDYGVVRNHYYNLTISKIQNLGTSVFDPNEDIIKSTVDNTLYFIGARINILSWKIVNQEVEL